MRRCTALLFPVLVCFLLSYNTKAQDKNLELHTEKIMSGCIEKGLCGEELAVGMESAKAAALAIHAWKVRDAKLFLSEPAMRDNVQRRMEMTKSIDQLRIDVEVEAVKGNEATVLTSQKFSRLLELPDGKERRRITSVTHRETWERSDKGWKLKGFTEENQTARWEDERPAQP